LTVSFCVYQNSALSGKELLIINAVQSFLKDVPLEVAKFITHFGHEINWKIAILLAILFIFALKKIKFALLYFLSLPSAEFIYSSIKAVIERPRPPLEMRLIEAGNYSFPSGHSTMSMVAYGLLIYFIYKYVENKYLKITLISLLSLLILFVGFSRIWVGVHFPTDVIGGFSLGICIICIFSIINEIKLPFTK
jgi:undecaprenyl-diphosphatase